MCLSIKKIFLLWLFAHFTGFHVTRAQTHQNSICQLVSPQGKTKVTFRISENNAHYSVEFNEEEILSNGSLGYILKGNDSLTQFHLIKTVETEFYEKWKTVWGQTDSIENSYKELKITLAEKRTSRQLVVTFRAYDEGFAFRYEIPAQKKINSIQVMDEVSGFNLLGAKHCWWSWADYNTLEKNYYHTAIDSATHAAVPFTFQTHHDVFVSIHEAGIEDYSTMTLLQLNAQSDRYKVNLVPWADGMLVKSKRTLTSPWRAFIFAEKPGDLLTSNLIQNLNKPSKIKDVSWIQPMNYCGIWWEMHLGISTWAEGPRHGVTTQHAKQYIDFAAENGIKGFLMEGWNTGWENWGKKGAFDFVSPTADLDLKEVVSYAYSKGIEIIGHHETGGDIETYEKQVKKAFRMYQKLGIHAVKTGYAGPVPNGEYHHGQYMVRHCNKIMRLAARYKIMLDVHEPVPFSGLSRTYPNLMTGEGLRGMEWNAWSEGNHPTHTCTLPFTRGIMGPMDYTPAIFDIDLSKHKEERATWNVLDKGKSSVHSTLSNQLALLIVLYSPLQMMADLPENYIGNEASVFFKDLPGTWDETKILDASIGEYLIIARRNGNTWYVGGITNEVERTIQVPFNFLDKDKTYRFTMIKDTDKAHFEKNPETFEKVELQMQTDKSLLEIAMKPGGGFAIKIDCSKP